MDAGRAADLYDAVVVGGGPAGLAAALYLARARYTVLVVEKDTFGGQITITAEVVNYPGVEKTEGHSLTETMRRQALHFGAEFLLAEAQGIDVDGDFRIVRTSRGAFRCFAVLLATGAHPRKVGFEGEETFRGRGVAYCATCDGGFFTDRDVFVVGGGFAAAEEAMFLTRYARSVTMLVRRSTLSCAESIAEQVLAHESVRVRFNTVLEAVEGDTALRRAVFRDTVTGRLETYAPPEGETFGVFVFAGYEPASRLAEGLAELAGQGNIVTDREQRTRTEGVYAAGDVCDKRLRQVVTAVSDGAVAATSIERYAADMQRKTGLRPQRPATAPASSGASKASAPSGNARETEGGFLTAEQREQLAGVFARMERPLILKAEPDSRPVSEDLRRMQGYMIQETHLFCDSIAENIRIAKLDATREEIEEACKKASIHDFILSLPQGYDTPVGELGDTLSGGERQRIGLARAFLHDAPMMLLDEPTSNLDSLNESVILRSLREELGDKLILLVSHRDSTMRIADQVYQMKEGRVS